MHELLQGDPLIQPQDFNNRRKFFGEMVDIGVMVYGIKEGEQGTELEQESVKKKKIDDEKDTVELQQLVKIIPDEEGAAIDAMPLAIFLISNHILKDFDKEDVETLWKLGKAKYGSTRPQEDYERVLWGDLKVMFDPHTEDDFLKMQQRYNVVRWILFNSCVVHCLSLQLEHIYMLVEKRYPLTLVRITNMLNKKLNADYFVNLSMKKLDILKKNIKFGGIVRIKSLYEVTAIKVRVTAAKINLVLFSNVSEKYAK
nr:hypothetical protein [Tanacetum cinerariifolium]